MHIYLFASFILLLVARSCDAGCGCPANGKRAELKVNETLMVDDMNFAKKDMDVYEGSRASIESKYRWPGGKLYYAYKGSFTSEEKRFIKETLGVLNKMTKNCVSFIDVTGKSLPAYYVSVVKGSGCHSMIGRVSKGQELSLKQSTCFYERTILHEFIHALGFYHEQSRPDREKYLKINWGNIESGHCFNFEKCKGCRTTTKYDIYSIMQYRSNSFTCNKAFTMTSPGGKEIPHNLKLTKSDIQKIMTFYGCKGGENMGAWKTTYLKLTAADVKKQCGSLGGFPYFSKQNAVMMIRCNLTQKEIVDVCPRGGKPEYNKKTGDVVVHCN